jgi:uncharacterized membrane protein
MTGLVKSIRSVRPARIRIESVDILRGLIMILMALDHVREFVGTPGINPTDLANTTTALFFTRWITHFCAPVFFLLTGTGAFLSLRRKSIPELSRFLWTRGLWLIFLEVVVTRCLGWQFNFDYRLTLLFVLWALGWSMITLAALIHMRPKYVAIFGIVMIATHNLLDPINPAIFGAFAPIWLLLHQPGVIFSTARFTVFEAYPLIPWVGVTAAGYALGQIYNWDATDRRVFLKRLGLALIGLFVVLRAWNVYGDPSPWSRQHSAWFTVLSFINTTKYAPSLLFLLMTLGPALLLLRWVDGWTPAYLRPALIIGKVPMFYFILHITLAHTIAVLICLVQNGQIHWMLESPDLAHYPISFPPGWGLSLPGVYVVWGLVVILLYPLCKWYAALKHRRTDWWLSYI